jgi:hypothetical protein
MQLQVKSVIQVMRLMARQAKRPERQCGAGRSQHSEGEMGLGLGLRLGLGLGCRPRSQRSG